MNEKKKIGIVGFGNLGKFLAQKILFRKDHELSFIWNRSFVDLTEYGLDSKLLLQSLDEVYNKDVDLIVEVSHPEITKLFGKSFLQHSHYMIGSPSALADAELFQSLSESCELYGHNVYVPCGAMWGSTDVRKMAETGTLGEMRVTMTFHPDSIKTDDVTIRSKLSESKESRNAIKLFDGAVRQLCKLAPNNVNTMAVAAISATNLGFDNVQGVLISDPQLANCHITEIEVWGKYVSLDADRFYCKTVRKNPAMPGHVTGSATFQSFYSSLLRTNEKDCGIHIC